MPLVPAAVAAAEEVVGVLRLLLLAEVVLLQRALPPAQLVLEAQPVLRARLGQLAQQQQMLRALQRVPLRS